MPPVFTLSVLGGLALSTPLGPVVGRVTQRRRLALLAVLTAERRPVSRDKLLGLFWPETDAESGRHLLADSLYVLRAGLGEDALTIHGEDIGLNAAGVTSDLAAFFKAIADGQLEHALTLYTGPFLDGVFISAALEFERWAAAMRTRLESDYHGLIERLAVEAGARGDHASAVTRWRQLANSEPVSSRVALALLRALARAGDSGSALQFARVHEQIVREELNSAPDPAIVQFVEELRANPKEHVAAPRSSAVGVTIPHASVENDQHQAGAGTPSAFDKPTPHVNSRTRRDAVAVVAGIIALSLVGWIVLRNQRSTTDSATTASAESRDRSIAVLPFEAISSDPRASFIAAGISDALTGDLDRLRKFRVVSRTSSHAVQLLGLPATSIGDTLNTRYLVEGSIRLVGSQLRIAVQLSDSHDGKLLWSEQFARSFTPRDVILLEDAIARSIATALNVRLSNDTSPSFVGSVPANTEAYTLYLRGRYLWNSRNPDAVKKSMTYFDSTIHSDSTFAPAYAGLADAYITFGIGNVGDFRADEYFPRARTAALRALSLDGTLAEAHASLGYIELLYDLDWESASRELSRALQLSPSNSTARIYQAILFEWTSHFDEALREAQSAQRFDPLSPVASIEVGRALFFLRKHDAAAAQFHVALELDSTSFRGHLHLGQVYVQERRFGDAIRELQIAAERSTNSSRPLSLLAHAYASAGRTGNARQLLDSLRRRARRNYVPAFDFAIIHAGLGEKDATFAWLDRAIADHSIRPFLLDPTFDLLRQDGRYRALLGRLHLPWPSIAE